MLKAAVKLLSCSLLPMIFIGGFVLPEHRIIPVQGATPKDWNPHSYWYYPWGRSGVHKGIDIFATEGTPVVASTDGLVFYTGNIEMGGNVVLMLGANWRLFYYAHLRNINATPWQWLKAGTPIGSVGTTGNAFGKPPHLHFSIFSVLPQFSQFDPVEPQAWKKIFYVNPDAYLQL